MKKSLLVLLGAFFLCGAVLVGCNNNVEPTKPEPSTTPTETTELAIALLNPQASTESMLLYADKEIIPAEEATIMQDGKYDHQYPRLALVEVTKDKNGNVTKTAILLNVSWTGDSEIEITDKDLFVEVSETMATISNNVHYWVSATYKEVELTVYIHTTKTES